MLPAAQPLTASSDFDLRSAHVARQISQELKIKGLTIEHQQRKISILNQSPLPPLLMLIKLYSSTLTPSYKTLACYPHVKMTAQKIQKVKFKEAPPEGMPIDPPPTWSTHLFKAVQQGRLREDEAISLTQIHLSRLSVAETRIRDVDICDLSDEQGPKGE
ncbi:MAG: hypothetical protein K0S07_933 [Chlamydiales bacterium]|jgi:hypothetical protein|nr:hypothetical protein [Chlamydiales bacterium]